MQKSNTSMKMLAAGMLSALTLAMPAAAADTATLKFASFVSPMSINNRVSIPAFIEAVEAASDGTLKIEHYPGGTLGSSPATQLKLVEDGVVDIAEVVAAYTPGRFKELEMFELPFVFNNSREAGLTANAMYEAGQLTGFDDLHLVGIIEVGPYALHSAKPLAGPSDLRGQKVRAGGATQVEMIKRLGAVPVGGISATKIAENISRRVLNGTLMDDGNLFNFRIADAAEHHVINVPLGNVAVIFPMRKDTYEALPAKARAALDQYAGVWFTDLLNTNLDAQIAEARGKLAADDAHTVTEWSEADVAKTRELMQGVEASWTTGDNLYGEMLSARDAVRASQ